MIPIEDGVDLLDEFLSDGDLFGPTLVSVGGGDDSSDILFVQESFVGFVEVLEGLVESSVEFCFSDFVHL